MEYLIFIINMYLFLSLILIIKDKNIIKTALYEYKGEKQYTTTVRDELFYAILTLISLPIVNIIAIYTIKKKESKNNFKP